MALFSARKRMKDTERLEANGQDLWTEKFDETALRRLDGIWSIVEANSSFPDYVIQQRISLVLRAQGGYNVQNYVEPGHFVASRMRGTDFILDLLGAIAIAVSDSEHGEGLFVSESNKVLNEHRIAFRFLEDEIVPISSDELHQEVVEPALRLLVSKRFTYAHDSYLKALREIQNNDPGDAITDAATALQHTLEALGCKGNTIGKLWLDGKKRGLVAEHDSNLSSGISKFVDWASADRSETGDAHHHSDATLADAWLQVHVVGAIIVRLADPGKSRTRSTS